MKRVALIVVDLQEDFINGSLAIEDANATIPSINKLITSYPWSSIIATQDWHPKNHASFASQHDAEPFTQLPFKHPTLNQTTLQTVWPDHCIHNTPGSNFDSLFLSQFDSAKIDKKIIRKGLLQDREYYLAFQDTWGLHQTELSSYLKSLDITHTVFVGLAYDYCVLNSAKDSATLNFRSFVIKDCCKSVNPTQDSDSLYEKAGVTVLNSSEDLKDLFTEL